MEKHPVDQLDLPGALYICARFWGVQVDYLTETGA